jgi:hypothetical protein
VAVPSFFACIFIFISVAYACSSLEIDSDYIKYAPVGAYAYVGAWVVANGPVYYEGWTWTWPGFYDVDHWDHVNGYESHSWGKCDTPGWYYYVTVSAVGPNGQDSADTLVRIFKMDLDISGVSDENEESLGGYICVNDDDDNNNTIPDKEETGTVSDEDDLVPISLSYEPSSLYPGYIRLSMPYSNNMKVWSSSEKGTLVIDEYNRNRTWYYNQMPSTLYVEGIYTNTLQELHLYYTPDGQNYPGGDQNHDLVKFNVYDICETLPPDIVAYWDSFLPGFECPEPGGPTQVARVDKCGNRLAIFCDTNNSGGFEAFSWWYRPFGQTGRGTEVGLCIWAGGKNKFDVRISFSGSHGKERFLKTRHSSKNDNKGSSFNKEGCPGYWCYKVQRYDCITPTFETGSPWWRRDDDYYLSDWWENEGTACVGPPYKHPTK